MIYDVLREIVKDLIKLKKTKSRLVGDTNSIGCCTELIRKRCMKDNCIRELFNTEENIFASNYLYFSYRKQTSNYSTQNG